MTASVVDAGVNYGPYTSHVARAGNYARLTASGLIKTGAGQLLGVIISSTSSGTITLYDNTSAAAPQITGTITPAAGQFLPLHVIFKTGAYAAIGGTIDATFVYL